MLNPSLRVTFLEKKRQIGYSKRVINYDVRYNVSKRYEVLVYDSTCGFEYIL